MGDTKQVADYENAEFYRESNRIRAEISLGPKNGKFVVCGFGSTCEDAFAAAKALKAELYSSAEDEG